MDVYYRKDYVFKTFLSSEGTFYRIGTTEGQKNEIGEE